MATTIVTTNLTTTQSLTTSTNWFLADGASVYVTSTTAVGATTTTSVNLDLVIHGDIVGGAGGIGLASSSSGANTGQGEHDVFISETGSVTSFSGYGLETLGYNNEVFNYGTILSISSSSVGVFNDGDDYILANFGSITGATGVDLNGPASAVARVENSGIIDGHYYGIGSDVRLFLNNSGTIIGTTYTGDADGIHISSSASSGSVIRNSGTISGSDNSIEFYSSSNTVINTGELIGDVRFYGAGENLFDGRGGTVDGTVFGGTGDDVLIGGDGDDRLAGGHGADTIYGGAGNDTATYTQYVVGVDVNLTTGIGSGSSAEGDRLVSIENLVGSTGDDTLTGHGGVNELWGGAGIDTLEGRGGADVLYGEAGDDILSGENGNDTIYGGDGNDAINGGNDSDVLHGDDGNDIIYGGAQNDVLFGDLLHDELYGENGNDILWGGYGVDTLYGGSDEDVLHGGAGNDDLFGDAQNDILNGDGGFDYLSGGNGNDILNGGDHGDELYGGNDSDVLNGEYGDDELYGEGQADTLDGGDGNDILDGGNGNDSLTGGADNDTLTGGINSDVFVFGNSFGVDVITDFNHWDANEDIDLSGNSAISSYADLVNNHLSTNGAGDAVITDGANTITLTGVTEAQLAADDFIF